MKKLLLTAVTLIVMSLASQSHAKSHSITGTNSKLPFIGTKEFNFMGGSATNQSITIKKDGSTTILFHGMSGNVVEYKGKFKNPLPLRNDDGTTYYYEIKGNKILQLDENKKLDCTMQQDDNFCIAELN